MTDLVSTVVAVSGVRLENLDPVPEPADVNAGTLGLLVLLLLVAAVVVLVVLMNRQLKRVNRKNAEGAYDDLPGARRTPHDRAGDPGDTGGEGRD
ncbi:hypothetical protein KLP28_11750 [Nocardioidaceae bacterium]|nr:hypothetical protein KLP28_11750 [Nocardioidaceae bacterium]